MVTLRSRVSARTSCNRLPRIFSALIAAAYISFIDSVKWCSSLSVVARICSTLLCVQWLFCLREASKTYLIFFFSDFNRSSHILLIWFFRSLRLARNATMAPESAAAGSTKMCQRSVVKCVRVEFTFQCVVKYINCLIHTLCNRRSEVLAPLVVNLIKNGA